MQDEAGHSSPDKQHPLCGAKDLYILTLGVFVGLMLGPWVLGQLHPVTYNRLFTGVDARLYMQLEQTENAFASNRGRLLDTGVTEVEVEALNDRHVQNLRVIQADIAMQRGQRTYDLQRVLAALVVAVLAVMVVEAVAAEHLRGGLATARYAILAVWMAIGLAQPSLLAQVPAVFTLGLIAVALLAALVPLRRRV